MGGTVNRPIGTGLMLQNNAGDDLPIAANGCFSFATALLNGASYAIGVKSQSKILTRVCTVSNGNGTVAKAAVANVMNQFSASVSAYTIDASTSALSPMAVPTVAAGNYPVSVVLTR